MRIEPVVRLSLVDTVVEKLRKFIESKHLEAGDRLPTEPELATQLGVSRTVLREALGRLETIGLITVQRGRGMFVGDRKSLLNCAKLVRTAMAVTPTDWLSLIEFRAAIECDAARRASLRATDLELDELEALCRRMDEPGLSHIDSVQRDFEFHHQIVKLGGNELMANTMEVLHEFIIAGMVQTTSEPRNNEGSQRLHLPIVTAIRSRDQDIAEKAMRHHMDLTEQAIQRAQGISKQSQVAAGS